MVLLVMGCSTTERVAVRDEPGICAFLGEVCHEPKSDLTQYHQVMVEVVGFFGKN